MLARLLIERDELKARAKRAETEARALRKKVQSLEARLRKGKRPYRRGNLTAEKAVRIMTEEGWRTQDGNPPTVRWIYRINSGEILPPLWFPVGLKCTEDAFRQMVIEAVEEQREIAEMGYTPREAVRDIRGG